MVWIYIIAAIAVLSGLFVFIKHLKEQRDLKKRYIPAIEENILLIPSFDEDWNKLVDEDHYFTGSEMDAYCAKYKESYDILAKSEAHGAFRFISDSNDRERLDAFLNNYNNIQVIREKHNKAFVASQLTKQADFLGDITITDSDSGEVKHYSLDTQQRTAVVTLEDATLVISAAGSGKSTTVVGKVKYLVEQRGISPDRILLITFTRKAAISLSDKLSGHEGLSCHTFHSLGMSIIAKHTGRKPTLGDTNTLGVIIDKFLRNPHNLGVVTDYLLNYSKPEKDLFEYKNKEEYERDKEQRSLTAKFPDMDGHPINCKSNQEKMICHFLSKNGIQYRYEEAYPIDTVEELHGQYHPDFTIHYTKDGEEKCLYLEHFAIGADGNTPAFFKDSNGSHEQADADYKAGIEWKRKFHAEQGSQLIETTSAMLYDGTWENHLLEELKRHNVPLNPLTPEEILKALQTGDQSVSKSITKFVGAFVSLMKANMYTIEEVREMARFKYDVRGLYIIDKIISPIYREYVETLSKNGEIDFIDLILKATEICEANPQYRQYDYIIVDEFQDISKDRYRLLKSLRNDKPMTKMFCVGDDWQSIFRFTGSDMGLFTQFKDYFGCTAECRIETTYRFKQPLISSSSKFIMMNPSQAKKNVRQLTPACDETIRGYMAQLATKGAYSNPTFSKDGLETEMQKFYANVLKVKYYRTGGSKVLRYREWFRKELIEKSIPYEEKHLNPPQTTLSMFYYERGKLAEAVVNTVRTLPNDGSSVLLLGRYSWDYQELKNYPSVVVKEGHNDENVIIWIDGRECQFMTAHKSKGLEADHVILLGCNEGLYGFPSAIEGDPILSYLLTKDDQYEYGEERRLFYVAITRSKKQTIILFEHYNESIFIKQLYEHPEELLCPLCRNGYKRELRNGICKNGNLWFDYQCSNPYCLNKSREFYNFPSDNKRIGFV